MTSNKIRHWRSILLASGVLTILIAAGVYVYLRAQTPDLGNVNAVMKLVSTHMMLPTDETPALVTVTNPSKLTTDFLKQTKVDDKILIYETHKRAIIYRPSADRIVDVGPVVIDAPLPASR